MRKEQWQFLIDIKQTHSINMTSRKFSISPQALGKSLRALEDEIGFPLLHRSHVGVSLTKEGEEFVALGTIFYTKLEQIRDNYIGRQDQAARQRFELWSSASAIEQEIVQLAVEYDELFPWLDLQIVESNFKDIIQRLLAKEIALGLCSIVLIDDNIADFAVLPEEIAFLPIRSDKMLACFSVKSPLAAYSSISIKTLMRYPVLARIFDEKPDRSAIRLLEHYGFKGTYSLEKSKELFMSKLATGKYVTLEKGDMIGNYGTSQQKLLKTIPLRENIQIQTGYVMRKEEPLAADSVPALHLAYLQKRGKC